MKTLVMLLLFISAFIIITGIHEQRLAQAKDEKEVVYRYIPRSALDEQLYGTPASTQFLSMFADKETPWVLARPDAEERAIHSRPKMFQTEPVKQIFEKGNEKGNENSSASENTIGTLGVVENFAAKTKKYPRNPKGVREIGKRIEQFGYQDETDDEYTSDDENDYETDDDDK